MRKVVLDTVRRLNPFIVLFAALAFAQGVLAQGTQSTVSFDWVTVGDPGNPNDPLTNVPGVGSIPHPERGAVPYVYSISKYETTIGQYAAYLNATGQGYMDVVDYTVSGIARVGTGGNHAYHVRNLHSFSGGRANANLSVTYIDYLDAVRFVNWLHNGQGNGSTETGAYTISGGQITRNPDARYWIPTENEWYKAAYYDPSPDGPADDYWLYPWRSDVLQGRPANFYNGTYTVTGQPTQGSFITFLTDVGFGTPSYYGTAGQAGNVEEYTEGDAFSEGPRFRGGHWQAPAEQADFRMRSFAGNNSIVPHSQGRLVGFRVATVATRPPGGLWNGDKIRFYPRAGLNNRMVGGVFEADGTVLHTITEVPSTGWTEIKVNFEGARYLRYRSPNGGYGNVAEIEFYRSGAKVIGAASGTPGSWSGKENDTFKAALDGNTSTFFDAPQGDGAYVEIDTGSGTSGFLPPGHVDRLTINSGSGAVEQPTGPPGTRILVDSRTPPAGQYFAGWEGFTSILDDPFSSGTMATLPGIGVDLWVTAIFKPLPPGSSNLEVRSGSGDGVYPTGTIVTVSANLPPAGQQFTRWSGDTAILSNPFLPTTTGIIPSMNVLVSANYSEAGLNDKIRFSPRPGWTERMVGGVFEGTHEDPLTGPYRTLYTVTNNPPAGWSEVSVSLVDDRLSDVPQYRYLRYRGPNGSHGNVAEIEFYRAGAKLTGTGFGTPGSWSGSGNTFEKALDGDVNSFFDAPNGDGNYTGIDTSSGGTVSGDKIRFYPRSGWTERMWGGVFEGTNGDPVNGPYTTIHTVTNNPALAWNEVSVSLGNYRYLRYRGPIGSHGNVAEIEFYRNGVKLTGTGFGTPGSWSDSGNTFEKALDGGVNTFFDAPTHSGNYVGIDTQ